MAASAAIFSVVQKKYIDKLIEGTAKYIPKDWGIMEEKFTVKSNFFAFHHFALLSC